MSLFADCFGDLPDPRTGNAQRHELLDMLVLALAACLCGAKSCVDFADFGRARRELFATFLPLKNGVPSHDTFSRLFRLLDPAAFSACFTRFVAELAQVARGEAAAEPVVAAAAAPAKIVAIDGKTLRRSFDRVSQTSALHMVSAFATHTRLVLGQLAVADKSNEIVALRELLGLLDIHGATVTADALHAQKLTARAILDKGADYVLALKDNQPGLVADVDLLVADLAAEPVSRAETADADHGRVETRKAAVFATPWLAEIHAFPGLAAVAVVEASRELNGRTTTARRSFLLSSVMSAESLLQAVRAHWAIENSLHWVLDVTFDEDRARNRKDHGPKNLAVIRHLALNILRNSPLKRSVARKIKLAGWDDTYLFSLIAQMR